MKLPLNEITIETMKKLIATIASDSLHVNPIAMILLANCHVAALSRLVFGSTMSALNVRATYLKASEIQ
jgi:hypothetical protein